MIGLQERRQIVYNMMVPPPDVVTNANYGSEPTLAVDRPVPDGTRHYRDYVSVTILFFINLINYMDRYTVAGVLDGITTHYSLNNSDGGLLQTVFVVTYMLAAPIFGYLGDRYNRRLIMAFGVFFWSATTLLGSLPPKSFSLFALLRALVGVGEASYSTVAPTIIGDLFVGPKRTSMLAFFYFAIPVGSGLGYIVGSAMAGALGAWYWALRVTPLLGAVAVLLILFVLKEPLRGASDGGTSLTPSSLRSDLRFLVHNQSYLWSTLGFTCVTFATGALSWWAPTYMIYAFQVQHSDAPVDKGRINLIFGVITTLAGITGVSLGSTLSARLGKRYAQADPLICAGGMVFSVPLLFLGAVFAHRLPNMSWTLFYIGITSICLNWSIVADILLYTVVPTRRATAAAFQILCSHLLGDASSPYVVGLLSDGILGTRTDSTSQYFSLQYAMYVPVCILILGSLFFFILSWHIENDRNLCTRLTQEMLSGQSGLNDMSSSSSFDPLLQDRGIQRRQRDHQH